MIDYKQTVINGYNAHKEQGTSYASYFQQQAQVNKRDNFVKFADFFSGCKKAVKDFKFNIERQLYKEQSMLDWVIRCTQESKYEEYKTEQEIEIRVEHLQTQRNNWNLGSFQYHTDFWNEDTFNGMVWYSDFLELEQAIIQAEEELTLQPYKTEHTKEQENNLPKVFVSYSYDDEAHENWVYNFVEKLKDELKDIVTIIFDKDIPFGKLKNSSYKYILNIFVFC